MASLVVSLPSIEVIEFEPFFRGHSVRFDPIDKKSLQAARRAGEWSECGQCEARLATRGNPHPDPALQV
jgi:hypothetical protein